MIEDLSGKNLLVGSIRDPGDRGAATKVRKKIKVMTSGGTLSPAFQAHQMIFWIKSRIISSAFRLSLQTFRCSGFSPEVDVAPQGMSPKGSALREEDVRNDLTVGTQCPPQSQLWIPQEWRAL